MITLILSGKFFLVSVEGTTSKSMILHGAAIGTAMAVTLANIFMADIEIQILSQSVVKPTGWKRLDVLCGTLVNMTWKRPSNKQTQQVSSSNQIYG